jgi:ABC-type sugar transport system ATPase subunit
VLRLENVSKSFGAVKALDNASLSIERGEIRAFLGANGSGKSTMVKLLSGLLQKDAGTILSDGREMEIRDPDDARGKKIIAAYQDLSLIPKLSVADNLSLGHEKLTRFGLVDTAAKVKLADEMIGNLEIEANPDTLVEQLDPSNQSLLEFAKALAWNPEFLLIDEITASLYKHQVECLFRIVRELSAQGVGILFVSHRLDEVFSLCSTATVLRSGSTVAEVNLSEVSEADLVYYMTGKRNKTEEKVSVQVREQHGQPVLEVADFSVQDKVRGLSLDLYPGEIVGLAGLQGQGQSEFLRALYGVFPFDPSSTMKLEGDPVRFSSPSQAIKRGIGFLPGDREREGIFSSRSIAENLFAARDGVRNSFALESTRSQRINAGKGIDHLHIVTAGPFVPASSLSGGNQQKLIVGRWLEMPLKILILDDPTKGVDIGSRREIHNLLRRMAKEKGTALLYSSSDNEELLEICDSIAVMYEGKITEVLHSTMMTAERLASATLGVTL